VEPGRIRARTLPASQSGSSVPLRTASARAGLSPGDSSVLRPQSACALAIERGRAQRLNPRPSPPKPLSRARGRGSQERRRNRERPKLGSFEATVVSRRHLPFSEEGVAAGETHVQAEALHDHTLKLGPRARVTLSPRTTFGSTPGTSGVLRGARPGDKRPRFKSGRPGVDEAAWASTEPHDRARPFLAIASGLTCSRARCRDATCLPSQAPGSRCSSRPQSRR
jgi:hypothetical protein